MDEKSSNRVIQILKLVGLSFTAGAVLILLVGLYTLITGFSLVLWSERAFWVSLFVLMIGAPPLLASLNDKNDYKRTKKERAPINMTIGKGENQIVIVNAGQVALRILLAGGFSFACAIILEMVSR